MDFEADPVRASQEAMRLLRAETVEATEDMLADLEDDRHDEMGRGTRYRFDGRDLVNESYYKAWQDFRTYHDMNTRGRRTSRRI